MKPSITIHTEATITVPSNLWPSVRTLLANMVNVRAKPYGESFITDTTQLSLISLRVRKNSPAERFLSKVGEHFGPLFTGTLIFQSSSA